MNTLLKECINDIEENKKPLSIIIQKCVGLAYQMKDIRNWVWLKLETIDISNDEEFKEFQSELQFFSKEYNIPFDTIKNIYDISMRKYIERRKDEEGNYFGFPISEVETRIEQVKRHAEINTVPSGLNQLDLYSVTKEKFELDSLLVWELSRYKKIYNSVKTKVYDYLLNLGGISIKENSSKGSDIMASEQLTDNKKVFIVHGHDDLIRTNVELILRKLNLEPIILNEQANQGKTIIEKLETHSDVGFAVVILSPDDEGKAKSQSELKPRARQNVIAELGYFIGKLGRNRVCPLYVEGVEIPSDFNGVGYILYDKAGKWKFDLANELKSCGYDIDLNKL
ncbi:MAG TPA: TIR domain-containing protein [Clostridia bacterium]